MCLIGYATALEAHEIGTTRVSATFHEGRYDIEIVTDAPSLVEKLNAVGGVESRTSASDPGAAALADRLTAGSDIFGQRLTVAFDGVAVHPAIRYAVRPAPDEISPILATIRLT